MRFTPALGLLLCLFKVAQTRIRDKCLISLKFGPQAALLGRRDFLFASMSPSAEARRGASRITLRGTSDLEASFFNDLKDQRLKLGRRRCILSSGSGMNRVLNEHEGESFG